MAKEAKLTLKFNLIDILHRAEKSKPKRVAFTKTICKAKTKVVFGKEAVDHINKRTLKSIEFNTSLPAGKKKFIKYSESYRKSSEFQLLKGNIKNPNLRLSGRMLNSMAVMSASKQTVTLGFRGTDNNNKAVWNQFGTFDDGGTMPPRTFFGLSTKEQEAILRKTLKVVGQ